MNTDIPEISARRLAKIVRDLKANIDWSGGGGETVMYAFRDAYPKYADEETEPPKRIFDGWFNTWAAGRISDVLNELSNLMGSDGIKIWRVITAPRDWSPDLRNVGIYWSYTKRAAQAHWGHFADGHVKWRIESLARADQIDWDTTLTLNADPTLGEDEKEIRLKAGVEIPLVALEVEDEPVDITKWQHRRYVANPGTRR